VHVQSNRNAINRSCSEKTLALHAKRSSGKCVVPFAQFASVARMLINAIGAAIHLESGVLWHKQYNLR